MSDDRYTREPGDDTEEPTPDRTYVDPKPRSWYGPASTKKPFDLAAECETFLAEYCEKFGIKRGSTQKKTLVRPPGWDGPEKPSEPGTEPAEESKQ